MKVFHRVESHLKVLIEDSEKTQEATMVNVSLGGIAVQCDAPVKEGDQFYNIIILLSASDIRLSFKAIMRHHTDSTYGFAFYQMDVEAFQHLKNLIQTHGVSAAELEEEIPHVIEMHRIYVKESENRGC